jgi:hypothetical protein
VQRRKKWQIETKKWQVSRCGFDFPVILTKTCHLIVPIYLPDYGVSRHIICKLLVVWFARKLHTISGFGPAVRVSRPAIYFVALVSGRAVS